jgi:hypothetical protein
VERFAFMQNGFVSSAEFQIATQAYLLASK